MIQPRMTIEGMTNSVVCYKPFARPFSGCLMGRRYTVLTMDDPTATLMLSVNWSLTETLTAVTHSI